jgi:L-iditol 2-dehydrogenase
VYVLPEKLGFAKAALTEPLACAFHAVDKMRVEPGETISVIGAGNMARLLVCALKAAGARVLVLGRDPGRLRLALAAGADEVINLIDEPDAAGAVRRRTDDRGADGVIEAVGKPEAWAKSVGMARKGGRVCLFGGCVAGSKAEIDTYRLHYEEVTVFGVFHHRPSYVRQALDVLGKGTIKREWLIDRELALEEVAPFFAANATVSSLKAAVVI